MPKRERVAMPRDETSILSPLRYPGSKRRLAGYIARTLALNEVRPSLFVELFAGGASVGLQLLNDGLVDRIGLVDRDPLVAAFWQTAFFDSEWLLRRVDRMEVSLRAWQRAKRSTPRTRRERAEACLLLNRTSYSGILASCGGPIGGVKQQSPYRIDCRFPRQTLLRRLEQVATLRDRVAFVWGLSWRRAASLIEGRRLDGSLPRKGITYYADPPFFSKAERLYTYYFEDDDHRVLRDFLVRLRQPWLLSYDVAPEVATLYGQTGRSSVRVEQLYTSSGSRTNHAQQEILITNLAKLPRRTRLWRRSSEGR